MVRMRRQGSDLHMQKLLFLSHVYLVFFLKDQVWFLFCTPSVHDFSPWKIYKELIAHLTCLNFFCLHQDFEKIQREEPLDLPPMPPQRRNWKGALVAPFASNNMLALYQCPGKTDGKKTSQDQKSSYFVQVLHNEAPVSMPVRIYFCNFCALSSNLFVKSPCSMVLQVMLYCNVQWVL